MKPHYNLHVKRANITILMPCRQAGYSGVTVRLLPTIQVWYPKKAA